MAAAPKRPPKNLGTPPGDFGRFLLNWFDASFRLPGESNEDMRERFRLKLEKAGFAFKSTETIRSWEQGKSAPSLGDFDTVAKVMGFGDWYGLVAAMQAARKSKRK